MSPKVLATWLGRVPYAAAAETQKLVAELRAESKLPDVLLLLEHTPVYTLGRRGTAGEVLLDSRELDARGIEVVSTDRGGRVTYHGPGQLVGYPVMDLGHPADLVAYVRRLEQVMIALAGRYGVKAATMPGAPGVWVGDAKLGAIGVHVSRGITTHGFAINVSPDLSAFNGIVPCGFLDKGVTSIELLTGETVPMEEVVPATAEIFGTVFGAAVELTDFESMANA